MIALAYRAALLLAGVLGLLLARRLSRYRPIPLVLLGLLLADLARELTPLLGEVFPRSALHLEQGLALAFPAASSWLALRILARHGAWAAVFVSAAVLAGLVLGYPAGRGEGSAMIFGAVHVAAVGAELGGALVAWFGERTRFLPERAVLVLVAGDAAQLLGPWLGAPARFWDLGVLQGIAALLVLCYVQIRWIYALRPAGAR